MWIFDGSCIWFLNSISNSTWDFAYSQHQKIQSQTVGKFSTGPQMPTRTLPNTFFLYSKMSILQVISLCQYQYPCNRQKHVLNRAHWWALLTWSPYKELDTWNQDVLLLTTLSMCYGECLIENFVLELETKITVGSKHAHRLLIEFGELWLENGRFVISDSFASCDSFALKATLYARYLFELFSSSYKFHFMKKK